MKNFDINLNISLKTEPEDVLKEFLSWAEEDLTTSSATMEDLFDEWWTYNSARFIDVTSKAVK